jgi:hypothetical protein
MQTISAGSLHGKYHVEHLRGGQIIWEADVDNQLYNEGQTNALTIWLAAATAPTNWFMGLMKNTLAALPARASTLASLNTAGPYELTNAADPGYTGRQQINRDATASGWSAPIVSGSGMQTTAKTVTFTASSGWTDTVRWMFLTTVGTIPDTTGKLISMAQLPADRTLLVSDQLSVTYSLILT